MIKKIFKWIGLTLLVVIVLGGSFVAHEWYADKPFMFRAYLDRQLLKIAFEEPETLTSLGFLESMGINGHNAHLDDVHPDRTDEFFADMKTFRDGLLQYDDEDLDAGQRLSKEIVLYLTNTIADAQPFRYHTYPANQMGGIQSAFPSFMDSSHQVHSLEDAENYLSRMSELPRKHEQYLLGLKIREAKDIVPPRFVIDRVLEQMRDFVATPAKENILYSSLAKKLSEAEEIDEAQAEDILDRVEISINENIYPAYDLFINYFSELEAKAGSDDGYWHLPDGAAAYKLALRLFTTTDYTADEIHQIGLTEVARIQAEMLEIFASEGIDVSLGFTDAMAAYSSRPEFYYDDNDEGRARILEDYQTILDEIDAGMDGSFNIRPKAGLEVVRVPEFKEKTAPGAYYNQPSIDGTRPGRFYANLYDIKATPKFGMRTLAAHEGIPGHHFQIAIAMELEGMPLLRKFPFFTAYTEGWALYAERVAWEQGLMPTPADNIGRLTAELFRAVRLVVDTGIHHERWTREEAIDYMLANTGMAESDVVSEIERYIVLPGQATAYKIGMIKILELRQKAMDSLGDGFDLRQFHDVVLKNGAVPMDILEQIVDEYIASAS
ncbi:MAG: DUF885 domain-containing protein [Gammaproteobacteria bacterium]|nr:DUF885 domain-containing protein [Gammaproteobacteria bacterium]MBT8110510.1 DUF885 domain-containing protein [Gammaproteobacteria bacterium]NND46394.1 DUF885 domain-containing protein [Woeseiaceae bacterium]NNL45210.1 DUF885 domain-containing protein [Woeseiaceae bacterium]